MPNQSTGVVIPILMYHSISETATARFRSFAVPPSLFAEHMDVLYQAKYTPLSVSQFVALREDTLPLRPIVLTFDDGFADFFASALPVLTRYAFPATLYLVTGYIGGTSRWLQHEGEAQRRMLTWEQVQIIATNGIECGAHTHTHPQLDTLSVSVACEEIVHSKTLLEQQLQQPVTSFAYPYGYYTAAVRRLVQEAGFSSACAVKFALSTLSTDIYSLARLKVHANISATGLLALLNQRQSAGLSTVYVRMRTPAWQLVRRSSAAISHYLHQEGQS